MRAFDNAPPTAHRHHTTKGWDSESSLEATAVGRNTRRSTLPTGLLSASIWRETMVSCEPLTAFAFAFATSRWRHNQRCALEDETIIKTDKVELAI
mmetsp:Transcript_398/g.1289  ORF Transcript_398/g.1289 Transcript_398/m.1289 type:complete len:96 (+) Transcript_398:454-741(+)